jgi:hypothetical protein
MSNIDDKLCKICFEKNQMKDYYCTTCKNIICDVCYSKVLLKQKKFKEDYLDNKLLYNCPFCKSDNIINVNVNHSINNNIIKGLIKQNNNIPAYENELLMDRFLDHYMISHNTDLLVENNQLKNKIRKLESELEKKKESNLKFLNICTNLKSDVNVLNYRLNESKHKIKTFENLDDKIKELLNTAVSSTKKTKFYKSLNTLMQ